LQRAEEVYFDVESNEEPNSMAHVLAFANQKGGVAKTTSTLNLGVALREKGLRVLGVDMDPQGNLTMSQGIDTESLEKSMYDVLVHRLPIEEVIVEREIDVATSTIDLAGAEMALSTMIGRERTLERALARVQKKYDYILIDTPPSLGLLTINALTASEGVIVPVQCEYLSLRGLLQLERTIEMIRENINPNVKIRGILPTLLDARTLHGREAVEVLRENFGKLVYKTVVAKTIRFAEAPVRGSSVLKYDPKGKGAEAYRALAREVLNGKSR
jgi:chromosome partitioning protein